MAQELKQWVALTVAATLAVLAAGWFLLISPRRGEAATLREQALSQEQQNAARTAELARLRAQAKGLPAQQAKLAAVATKIPEGPALPSLLRTLSDSAAEAGVELVALAPQPPSPLGGAAAPGQPAPTATALSEIPLGITVTGGYFSVEQFVAALEDRPRAIQVTGLDIAPAAAGEEADEGTLRATLTARVFLAPRPAAQPAAPAAPAAPATTTATETAG